MTRWPRVAPSALETPGQTSLLGQGEGVDVGGGPLQVVQLLGGKFGPGGVDLLPAHPQGGPGRAVKAGAVLRQGLVPPLPDIPDDVRHPLPHGLLLPGGPGGGLFQILHTAQATPMVMSRLAKVRCSPVETARRTPGRQQAS